MINDFRILVAASALAGAAALNAAPARQAKRDPLPPGEGRDVLVNVCSQCHDLEPVSSRFRTRGEWKDMIEEMAARGGTGPDDVKAIIRYAVSHLGVVNVNTASATDLAEIVQLTPAEGSAIVEFRKQAGEFTTLDDLKKVPNLDFARVDARKDHITFAGS